MKTLLPDLRNARAGIEPRRIPKTADAKPLGLKVVNLAADPTTTELFIYDEIDAWWGISAQQVADALAAVTTPNVRVRINSPGGDVFEGIAIMNLLASYNGVVTGVVDSLCASIATVIAMACDTITMSPGSQMMIHPASGICFGDEADMLQMASLLGFQTNNIAGLYAARGGGDQAAWLKLMQAETWMTADEAVAAGLADATGVVKQSGMAAVTAPDPAMDDAMWDLSVYRFAGRKNAPAPATVGRLIQSLGEKIGGELAHNMPPNITSAVEPTASVLTRALAYFSSIDLIVDNAQAELAAALGVPNPDPGEPDMPTDAVTTSIRCQCGPKGYRMAQKDHQHSAVCPALGQLLPRNPVNLPAPIGVMYELVAFDGCCDICQSVIDDNPYPEDGLPDVPVHPNCDCSLEVQYGAFMHAPDPFTAHFASAASPVAVDSVDLVDLALREAFV